MKIMYRRYGLIISAAATWAIIWAIRPLFGTPIRVKSRVGMPSPPPFLKIHYTTESPKGNPTINGSVIANHTPILEDQY